MLNRGKLKQVQVGLSKAILKSKVKVFLLVLMDSEYTYISVQWWTWSQTQLFEKICPCPALTCPVLSWPDQTLPVLTWHVLIWPVLTLPFLTWKFVNFCRTEICCTKNWGSIGTMRSSLATSYYVWRRRAITLSFFVWGTTRWTSWAELGLSPGRGS